eukprot:5025024-Pleurochrysis_carterae.AAC.3
MYMYGRALARIVQAHFSLMHAWCCTGCPCQSLRVRVAAPTTAKTAGRCRSWAPSRERRARRALRLLACS